MRLARLLRTAASVASALCVSLAAIIMTSCATPDQLPPWFDGIQRFPLHSAVINGHRIAYLDEGTGPPVILIHGFGGSLWQWEYQQIPLAAQARVITLDMLGSGYSDKPAIDYRPDVLIETVRGLMDLLTLPSATLIGNSMGGGVAVGMALTYPQRVDRLVLIDGLPDHVRDRLTSPLMRRAIDSRAPGWLARFGAFLFGDRTTNVVLEEIVHDRSLLTPAVLERSHRNRRRGNVIGPLMSIRESLPLWETDYAPRLKDLTQPTLILWGEHDRLFPASVGRDMQAIIPRSTVVTIPDAGHLPQWERPQVVNELLLAFLRS